MTAPKNPFDIVKATDLSDRQIADYFVDFPGGASLLDRIKPTSAMPMFIFGGKGSGKTHLMRYLSYQLVKRRRPQETLRKAVVADAYVGIYFKCGGLNAHRFAGKGQSDEVWQTVFAYYVELWFAQLVLAMVADVFEGEADQLPAALVADAVRLLDVAPPAPIGTLSAFRTYLEEVQREADVAINNSAITRQLNIRILATPGKLAFGLPQVIVRHCAELAEVRFTYLVDEFENLTEPQQRYVNTLVRERQDPCSLKIGVRLYGVRTQQTLSAGEENRENSEYEALRLDAELRERPADAQMQFAQDLVLMRLRAVSHPASASADQRDVGEWFETDENDPLLKAQFGDFARRYADRLPVYMSTLRTKLQSGLRAGVSTGMRTEADVDALIGALRSPEYPFVERTSVFLLYRAWAHGKPLPAAASEIAESAAAWIGGNAQNIHVEVLTHFRADIVAQLLRDAKMKQRYVGFETFVKMSAGLPRGLLTILKHVFTWSLFFGEHPFARERISMRAQIEGVAQASEWFFTEARAPGPNGPRVRDAMTRLGELLRDIRFSDKPSECSLSTFSADVTGVSAQAASTLQDAEDWSMLVKVPGGQHERNLGRVDNKYQVHPMLAARWDLPVMRRGALALSAEEVEAVFAPASREAFDAVLRRRTAAMTAPFFGKAAGGRGPMLPGIADG